MRINKVITVTANGPVNIVTGLDALASVGIGPQPRLMVRSLFVQMLHGGTGRGIVLDGIYGVASVDQTPRIPSSAVSTDVTAELSPASATAPGGSYSDSFILPNGVGGIQADKTWVDGSNPGDTIKVSYDTIEP